MERECHGPLGEQLFEGDEMASILGQHEGRHRIANSRNLGARAAETEPRNQPVHRVGVDPDFRTRMEINDILTALKVANRRH
jgi:hypothetical protein